MRLVFAVSVALLAAAAAGQQPASDPQPSSPAAATTAADPAAGHDLASADLAIVTRVEIDEIVFQEVHDPVVRLAVEPQGEVLSRVERPRLPEPVRRGVPYRDVVVEGSFAVWLDVETILRRATAGTRRGAKPAAADPSASGTAGPPPVEEAAPP